MLTPEFEADTLEFGSTGKITLDVKFHNPTTKFHGLNWVFENADADGVKPNPQEFYEKYTDERMFYIYILNEEGEKLDIESMTVTTKDNFILPHGTTEKYDEEQEKLLESEIIPETKEIPKWIKDIFTFYSEDLINDEEFVSALQFLIRSGIIQI